jgi:hypothetical protein
MRKCLLAVAITSVVTAALAATTVPAGMITHLGSGWGNDTMYVRLNTSPAGSVENCASSYYYVTDPTSADRKVHHAILLTAHAQNKAVEIYVQGCFGDYPKIIGILMSS